MAIGPIFSCGEVKSESDCASTDRTLLPLVAQTPPSYAYCYLSVTFNHFTRGAHRA